MQISSLLFLNIIFQHCIYQLSKNIDDTQATFNRSNYYFGTIDISINKSRKQAFQNQLNTRIRKVDGLQNFSIRLHIEAKKGMKLDNISEILNLFVREQQIKWIRPQGKILVVIFNYFDDQKLNFCSRLWKQKRNAWEGQVSITLVLYNSGDNTQQQKQQLKQMEETGINLLFINQQWANQLNEVFFTLASWIILDENNYLIQLQSPQDKLLTTVDKLINKETITRDNKSQEKIQKSKQYLQNEQSIQFMKKWMIQIKQSQQMRECQAIKVKFTALQKIERGILQNKWNTKIVVFQKNQPIIQALSQNIKPNKLCQIETTTILDIVVPKRSDCTECGNRLDQFYYWCYWSENKEDLKCRKCVQSLDERGNYIYTNNSILVHREVTKKIFKNKLGKNKQPLHQNSARYQGAYSCDSCKVCPKQKIARYISLGSRDQFRLEGDFDDFCEPCMIKYINGNESLRKTVKSYNHAFLRVLFPNGYFEY